MIRVALYTALAILVVSRWRLVAGDRGSVTGDLGSETSDGRLWTADTDSNVLFVVTGAMSQRLSGSLRLISFLRDVVSNRPMIPNGYPLVTDHRSLIPGHAELGPVAPLLWPW